VIGFLASDERITCTRTSSRSRPSAVRRASITVAPGRSPSADLLAVDGDLAVLDHELFPSRLTSTLPEPVTCLPSTNTLAVLDPHLAGGPTRTSLLLVGT
jgi:hypothetical protein